MNESLLDVVTVDRLIHEPARLLIVATLSAVEEADFLFLLSATRLTRGNLSSHLSRLEEAGYVDIEKTYAGKIPRTICRLTATGRDALAQYQQQMKAIVDHL